MTEQDRRTGFARNDSLEALLSQLNGGLEQLPALPHSTSAPHYPLILIVGAPRSGTTLLSQWLASTDSFSYPTNFISRFYSAPAIGALVQKMLFSSSHQFRDEFSDLSIRPKQGFNSELGKTSGVLAPNEFWYFWRRYFSYGEIQYLPAKSFTTANTSRMLRELGEFEGVSDKPLMMKGMCFNWNLPEIDRLLPKAIFLNVVRDPVATAYSLLHARERFYGDRSVWYSFKPPEYQWLQHLSPEEQVMGQVYFTQRSVAQGLLDISPERQISVDYEFFCSNPAEVYTLLSEKLIAQGGGALPNYQGVKSFTPRAQDQAGMCWELLRTAHRRLINGELSCP